jgi:predicted ATPase
VKIESITIKNYKSLQNITIDNIPKFSVFVGANGTGKSTLFDVFGFLRDALQNNVRQALSLRGGFKEVVARGHEKEDICFEIKFTMKILEKERLVTYLLEIGENDNKIGVKREILRYKRGSHGSPFHFLDFKNGQGYAITNEEDFYQTEEELTREDQTLETQDILAIKGLGQFQRFKAASAFRLLIENWHVSDFRISATKGSKDIGYAEHLSTTGDNLPLVAQYIYEKHPNIFAKILEKMKNRVPGISKVEAEETVDGRLVLRFQDEAFKDPFIDRYVSDGTIKMFAYLVLLHDPKPHPLLCIEEPENQLYPSLLEELAEEFASYSRDGQVFVSTHSPDFLNAVELDNIFWLEKQEGTTKVYRASDQEVLKTLYQEGDKPGALWKQELFGGANPK